MAKGFDCATPLTADTAASFKANGYEFVARYLVPATSAWKALTKAEADIIQSAGLKIVSVFETTAERALEGANAGMLDADVAMQCAVAVGQPKGSTIYFAVDTDVSGADMPKVMDYFRAVNQAITGYDVGVYGSYDVINAVKAAGLASHLWQTYAWSHGMLADCQIFQYKNYEAYDEDRVFGFEGAWGNGPTTTPEASTVTKLDPGVALTILNTWMSPSYKATNDQAQKDYIRWLGQELRKAAGLPLE